MSAPAYAAIGIYLAGKDRPTLMTANGKVILFDTPGVAKDFLPIVGGGRLPSLSADGEEVCFLPIDPDGVNRACVLTGYDPYNLPPGLPIRSETRGLDWRSHIHWAAWWRDPAQRRPVEQPALVERA